MREEKTSQSSKGSPDHSELFDSYIFRPALDMFNVFKEQAGSAPESYTNLVSLGAQFWGSMVKGMAEQAKAASEPEVVCDQSSGGFGHLYDMWSSMYEETLGKFLTIPPVGPAREYTEKIQHSMKSFMHYQAANVELQKALCVPLVESLKQIAEDMQNSDKCDLEKKALKEVQQEWIKTCEERFFQTLRSPEFSKILANSMDKTLDFWNTSRDTMEDYLKFFPVATSSEMEEVYKELYELKKQVRELRAELKGAAVKPTPPAAKKGRPPASAETVKNIRAAASTDAVKSRRMRKK